MFGRRWCFVGGGARILPFAGRGGHGEQDTEDGDPGGGPHAAPSRRRGAPRCRPLPTASFPIRPLPTASFFICIAAAIGLWTSFGKPNSDYLRFLFHGQIFNFFFTYGNSCPDMHLGSQAKVNIPTPRAIFFLPRHTSYPCCWPNPVSAKQTQRPLQGRLVWISQPVS